MASRRSQIGLLAVRALRRPVWIGGIKVAAVVGTLLNIVNHGSDLLGGSSPQWGGLMLNYFIPFCVSVYSVACVAARQAVPLRRVGKGK